MLVRPIGKFGNSSRAISGSEQKGHPGIAADDLFEFLQARAGKLDAVVISGGEPTLWPDLPDFIGRVRAMGYAVKLDTNGTNPEMLERLLGEGFLDYVAMDLKAPFHKYEAVTGVPADSRRLVQSVSLLLAGGRPYEFRTTLVPGLHEAADIDAMGEAVRGARAWFLQAFKSDTPLVNPDFMSAPPFSGRDMRAFRRRAAKYVAGCFIR